MAKYRSPFTAKCHMTTPFKKKGSWAAGYHTGEDWVGDDNRQLVSPCDGTVSYVSGEGAYGNHLIIHTADGNCILMAHMESLPCVKAGQKVKSGDKVGIEGSTGNSTGRHLHIEVEKGTDWNYNKNLLKPSDYIDFDDFGDDEEMRTVLKKGDSGIDVYAVKVLLMKLKEFGYVKTGVANDMGFGDGTEKAVKEFQSRVNHKVNGIVEQETINAMRVVVCNRDPNAAKIKNAQNALK